MSMSNVLERRNAMITLAEVASEQEETVAPAVQRYKEYEKAAPQFSRNMFGRHRKRWAHYMRARDLWGRTDLENRTYILSGSLGYNDERTSKDGFNDNVLSDPVYKILVQARGKAGDMFDEFRKTKRIKYENNSRRKPQAKRHKQIFKILIQSHIDWIRDRKMKEEEYNSIAEQGLMSIYIQAKETMDKIDARRAELIQKVNSGSFTEEERLESMYLSLCI